MPALLVLEKRHAFAFDGASEDGCRALGTARTCGRVVDLREVMAIDNARIDPERSDARGVRVHVPLQLGRPALAEAIDIDDRGEIGEDLVSCVVERLPDRSLGGLAIAHEHPHVERRREWALRRERDADPDRKPLAERPGGNVDPREHRRGMALEPAPELAERHELVVRDRAGRLQHRVHERRGMTLGKDPMVIRRILGMREVAAQVSREEDRHEIGRRQR